jgi:hypothetical protein
MSTYGRNALSVRALAMCGASSVRTDAQLYAQILCGGAIWQVELGEKTRQLNLAHEELATAKGERGQRQLPISTHYI